MPETILARLYDEMAADYERTRVPRFRPFVKRLLQLYDTRPGSWVLDVGCGTGLAATMVAPRVGHGGRVLGVDASPKMLELARRKAQGFGFDQCVFELGDSSHLELAADSFDVVICSFALWGSPEQLFGELLRVLKPGGALLLQNWEPERGGAFQTFNDTLAAHAVPNPAARLAAIRGAFNQHRTLWADYNTPQDYERALRKFAVKSTNAHWAENALHFRDLEQLIDFMQVGVRARAELQAMDPETGARFGAAVQAKLQGLATPKGIDVPARAIQVAARK